jgi:hypothetical protein
MRTELVLLPLILLWAGCQTSALHVAPPPEQPVPAPSLDLQEKVLRQQQHIQALIAQNEALHGRLRDLESVPPVQAPAPSEQPAIAVVETTPMPLPTSVPVPASPPTPVLTMLPQTAPTPVGESALMPNADGVIDLAAVLTETKPGDEVNPFAVRSIPTEAVREITLRVTGLIHGATPCALVNGRAVQPEEGVESLTLVRIETDAALFRHGPHLLRLPVSAQPIRVRLAL